MVILALIDLIREAIELALVRIELPLADKGIVVRERDGRSSAQAAPGDSHERGDGQSDGGFVLTEFSVAPHLF